MLNIIYLFLLIIIVLLFVNQINNYYTSKNKYELLKNHLFEYSNIAKIDKPLLWVYIDFEKNARQWIDFNTKNSNNLNKPYIYLTLKSIIDNCSDSFHVVIIDENCFSNLIPGWNIELDKLSNPLKKNYVDLAKLKILKNFGGLFLPPSFICKKDLKNLYEDYCIYDEKILSVEIVNNSDLDMIYTPTFDFIGCDKKNADIDILINQYELLISTDFTSEMKLKGKKSNLLLDNKDIVSIVDGKYIGVKEINQKPILIDNLMENRKLLLHADHYGLYIPSDELEKRNKYNWMLYLSPIEVLNTTTYLSYYLNHSM